MNSAEKPFENLNSSERDIFKICSVIIAWNPEERASLDVMRLRERAISLFQKMRGVDLAYDDSYYKYASEAKSLEQDYYKLRNQGQESEYIDSDFASTYEDIDIVATKILNTLNTGIGARTFFDWVPPSQEYYHNDYTSIELVSDGGGSKTFSLIFGELFDPYKFNSSQHIKTFFESLDPEIKKGADWQHYRHNEGEGEEETWLKLPQLSSDQARTLLEDFIKIIKSNPRKNSSPLPQP
jgi:hypothetical protein